MTSRRRTAATALVAAAAAAATPRVWVAAPLTLYLIRTAQDAARTRLQARDDQEHPHA